MADRKITLTIVETTHYGATFTLAELSALAAKQGVPSLEEVGGDIAAWLQDEMSEAIQCEAGMLEGIEESSGDVQGQTWEWVVDDAS